MTQIKVKEGEPFMYGATKFSNMSDSSTVAEDKLEYAKKIFTELVMRGLPLEARLRYKRDIAQSSSMANLNKICKSLVEEICQ
jgi:hypothetical protein